VTYGVRSASKLNKAGRGQYAKAGVEPGVRLVELRLDDTSGYSVGQEIDASILSPGDKIDVTAVSKGKGFAGGMKRHNFKGQGAAHRHPQEAPGPGFLSAPVPRRPECSRAPGWPGTWVRSE